MENLFLIAGLGNPGAEYAHTRHNAGFMVVERLAQRWQATWKRETRFQAQTARAEKGGRSVLLCRPLTFMNRSGEAVAALTAYYRVSQNKILVIVDDADLPLGAQRLRTSGSAGGHHGLESVERHLGSRAYARLRIGIGRSSAAAREITDYVLGKFQPAEMDLLEQVLERCADQAECWLTADSQRAMNSYNGTIELPGTKDS